MEGLTIARDKTEKEKAAHLLLSTSRALTMLYGGSAASADTLCLLHVEDLLRMTLLRHRPRVPWETVLVALLETFFGTFVSRRTILWGCPAVSTGRLGSVIRTQRICSIFQLQSRSRRSKSPAWACVIGYCDCSARMTFAEHPVLAVSKVRAALHALRLHCSCLSNYDTFNSCGIEGHKRTRCRAQEQTTS